MERVELLKCSVLARYDDATLIGGLKREAARQRIHTARVIALMSEVDARGLYREYAYPSMFEYATDVLHMSEGEAYPRIAAGRLARKYPQVLEMLASGELHLSAIRLLCPVMNAENAAENAAELLAAARHKTKRQVEHMLAQRAPKADVKSSVRKLPASRAEAQPGDRTAAGPSLAFEAATKPCVAASAAPAAVAPHESVHEQRSAGAGASSTAHDALCSTGGAAGKVPVPDAGMAASSSPLAMADVSSELLHENSPGTSEVSCGDVEKGSLVPGTPTGEPNASASKEPCTAGDAADAPQGSRSKALALRSGRSEVSPLSGDRYRVQFTASQRLHDKLEQARHLLRHQVPMGDLAEICERALDLLIAQRMKECFAVGVKPRPRAKAVRGQHGTVPNGPSVTSARRSAPETAPRLPRGKACEAPQGAWQNPREEADAPQSDPQRPPHDLPPPQSRHIPHEVQRQVLARDGLHCAYFSADGRRCTARGGLQFHHIHPFARGGEATVDNITLRCAAHNALAAEQDYGKAFMRKQLESSINRVREPTASSCRLPSPSEPLELEVPHGSAERSPTTRGRTPLWRCLDRDGTRRGSV